MHVKVRILCPLQWWAINVHFSIHTRCLSKAYSKLRGTQPTKVGKHNDA